MYTDFKWRHYRGEVILWAVRWYCRYGISYRELEEMLCERGVEVDHTTICRWVQRCAPEMERRWRWQYRPRSFAGFWRVDESYIKVNGQWKYLYRAVTKDGGRIDFHLSSTRNAKAAKRFPDKALRGCKDWENPRGINTDKAGCCTQAIRELKKEGKCPKDVEHRQSERLPTFVGSIPFGMSFQILKYDVIGDISAGCGEISTRPIALAQLWVFHLNAPR